MSGTLWFIFILLIVVGVYAAFSLYLLFNQRRMIYDPDSHISLTPDKHGYSYEDVILTTEDNLKLHGWYIPSKQNQGHVLFFHGNTGNISHRLETIEILHLQGFNVFIFDYRGFGLSEGAPSEQGTYLDAKAALAYLTQQRGIPEREIILFGRSLGGAIAVWLAARCQPKALVVESSFCSIPELGRQLYPLLPIKYLSRFIYDSKSAIQNVTVPTLIIHSPEDEVVPYNHGKALFEHCPAPKQMLDIVGRHNDGFIFSGHVYTEGLRTFFTKLSAQPTH